MDTGRLAAVLVACLPVPAGAAAAGLPADFVRLGSRRHAYHQVRVRPLAVLR